jgi:CheY-like chemotaxis protein
MHSTHHILLTDDDDEDRFIMKDAFREIGQPDVIRFVEDGEQLLSRLDAIENPDELPALIVLDLNMPRRSGTETLKSLKSDPRYQAIPVIIFSTSVNEIEMEKCKALGATSYITKPARFEDCIRTAQQFYDFSRNCCMEI